MDKEAPPCEKCGSYIVHDEDCPVMWDCNPWECVLCRERFETVPPAKWLGHGKALCRDCDKKGIF